MNILITSDDPVLLRILRLNLDLFRLSNGDPIKLLEYSPSWQVGKDHRTNSDSINLIVAMFSSAIHRFHPLLSQISMISEVWKIPSLVISDEWPSELASVQSCIRLANPFRIDDFYAKVESALLGEQSRNPL